MNPLAVEEKQRARDIVAYMGNSENLNMNSEQLAADFVYVNFIHYFFRSTFIFIACYIQL